MSDINATCKYPYGGLYSEAVRHGLGGTGIALEVCSITCNSIIVAAFARVKNLRRKSNVLILNIVLGDLFYCFACGFEIMPLFYYQLLCKPDFIATRTWFRYVAGYLNVFNISAVAFERFTAIQFPYRYHAHVNYSRCVAVAIGIWIFSVCMSTIRHHIRFQYVEPALAATLLLVVVVIYIRIYVLVRKHVARDEHYGVRVTHSKTMAAVLSAVVFGLSWTPIICVLVIKYLLGTRVPLSQIATVSLLLGSCFNLLVYTYRMEDFRKGVKYILRLDRNIVQVAIVQVGPLNVQENPTALESIS